MVPNNPEGAVCLGATDEMIRHVSLPMASSGIRNDISLALGRRRAKQWPSQCLSVIQTQSRLLLCDTGNTMASVIANQFGEII